METAYYVTHPAVGRTAVVYAPSTEKARTTFLDWLERNNLMRRADRQILRRNMVAQRLEDPNMPADVVLHYGYQDYSSSMRFPEPELISEEEQMEELEPTEPEPLTEPEPEPVAPKRMMPIQQVMLRGYME